MNHWKFHAQIWSWALLLPAFTFLAMDMCTWRGPRWLGPVASMLVFASSFPGFAVLFVLPAMIYYAISALSFWKRSGEFAKRMSQALACACFVCLWFQAITISAARRHEAFSRAAEDGMATTTALAKYHAEQGEYPTQVEQLIPAYLNTFPYTGMIGYPDFQYLPGHNDIQKVPGSYELRINCGSGGINFDRFIYWPTETYPDRIQGNRVQRIGAWAYIHE